MAQLGAQGAWILELAADFRKFQNENAKIQQSTKV
jgi:hypothetical protein